MKRNNIYYNRNTVYTWQASPVYFNTTNFTLWIELGSPFGGKEQN